MGLRCLVWLCLAAVVHSLLNLGRKFGAQRQQHQQQQQVQGTTALYSWKLSSKGGMMPGGPPGMNEISCIGPEGEIYFHPAKKASMKVPAGQTTLVGKPRVIPILPYGQVLAPTGTDWLNIFEMKHRMLLNEGSVFGFSYYSSTQSKLALVGTLARVKERKILEDGRSFVVIEGIDRFYIDEIVSERPYLKGKVQLFGDYTETTSDILDELELKVFNGLRKNTKMMERLFPSKNFAINPAVMQNRPHLITPGTRNVKITDAADDKARRATFSFGVLDMLQISTTVKLSLMQEHLLERRMARYLKILQSGSTYLEEELTKKGFQLPAEVLTTGSLMNESASFVEDLEYLSSSNTDYNQGPKYVNGQWQQGIMMM